ncbi:T9SS type A sorting domain-containing protein [Winogradskyella sp.]|uniref:T9SS type A sorting domain-containing protein n=1 Tax=Winogradskyella sp. TaxID=1883156 RepID=UPI003BAABA82
MKIYALVLFLSSVGLFSQTQIGQDIFGESSLDYSGGPGYYSTYANNAVSLSSDGTTVAVGATGNDDNGAESGHVRIYKNEFGVWTQVGQDIDGEAAGDLSGYSVSLSNDGTIVAIGATGNDGSGLLSGHVRIYNYNNTSNIWVQMGQDIHGESSGDASGFSIDLSSDGNIIAIGAPNNNLGGSIFRAGHTRIYMYHETTNTWQQIGDDIDGIQDYYGFGRSVSLSDNGSIIAIGAFEGGVNNPNNFGHVKIYKNIANTWIQVGNTIIGENPNDESGWSVSLSSDGTHVAIGAPHNDGGTGLNLSLGHIRIFSYSEVSDSWNQIGQDIDPVTPERSFGTCVSLSSNGSIVAVGTGTGHVRVLYYDEVSNSWNQVGATISDPPYYFGKSISLSSDGSKLAIGAAFYDNGTVNACGKVEVYDLSQALSTNEFLASQFALYPNPTKGKLSIRLDRGLELKKVTLCNGLGQQILTTTVPFIDTSDLSKGTYVVIIETNKGKSFKKIIID